MTVNEKKEFLNQYLVCIQRMEAKQEELEKYRELAAKVTSSISGLPKDQSGDRVQNSVERIVSLENEIREQIEKMIVIRHQVEDAINSLQSETLKNLMTYKYINGYTWEQIAVKMNYTWRHVFRLHGEALKHVIVCHTPSC